MGRALKYYHTELAVWQSSRFLARAAYNIAGLFPESDRGALADALRSAAIAIPANIAEGCGRGTSQELVRFLRVARGCAGRVHSHLTIATDLGYSRLTSDHPIFAEVAEVTRMIDGLLAALTRNSKKPAIDDRTTSSTDS